MRKKGGIASRVCTGGRYWYINPMGGRHAVNIKENKNGKHVIFDDNKDIPLKYLEGHFEYRR